MAKPVIIIKSKSILEPHEIDGLKEQVYTATNDEYYVILVIDPSNNLEISVSNE